jgi:hypothetical protein
LEQHRKVDDERTGALLKIEELSQQLKSTKDQRDHLDKKKRRLEDDVDRYKKRLHEAEKNYKNAQEDGATLKTALQDCKRFGERICGVVEKALPPPPPKKEEKDEKKDKKDEGKAENGEKKDSVKTPAKNDSEGSQEPTEVNQAQEQNGGESADVNSMETVEDQSESNAGKAADDAEPQNQTDNSATA